MGIPRTKAQADAEVKRFVKEHRRTLKALATGDGPILHTYRCPYRHTVEIPLPSGPVYCEQCGLRLRPAL